MDLYLKIESIVYPNEICNSNSAKKNFILAARMNKILPTHGPKTNIILRMALNCITLIGMTIEMTLKRCHGESRYCYIIFIVNTNTTNNLKIV